LKNITQLIYEADYRFAQPPKMPTLKAFAGDGKVYLSWDNVADQLSREPFLGNVNDFEGYKLYKSTDKLFADAEIVTNTDGDKMFKKPLFQCDLNNLYEGHVFYGAIGGVGYDLGDNTGISHYFVDEDVQNGRTYYYALVAYDYGAPDQGIAPSENNIVLELDEAENVIRKGINVAIVTPGQNAAGFQDPTATMNNTNTIGNAKVTATIYNHESIKPGHTYKVKFGTDTLGHIKSNVTDRHPMDMVLVNSGLDVYDVTEGDRLVYSEDTTYFTLENIIERDDRTIAYLMGRTLPVKGHMYRSTEIVTDNFDGIQLNLSGLNNYIPKEVHRSIPENGINWENTGWITGSSNINITPSYMEYYAFPYEYMIVFTGDDSAYVNRLNRKTGVNDLDVGDVNREGGERSYLFDQAFSFYVTNQTALDVMGKLDTLELVVEDVNLNGEFDILEDRILVGHAVIRKLTFGEIISWGGTVFAIDFNALDDESQLPQPGDVYRFDFSTPFFESDSITFTVNAAVNVEEQSLNTTMEDIKVVPNPYIMTNAMEPAVGNKFLNQRRRILFTHIPADCEINIFTSSGILVDRIEVQNEPSNGTVHWDLLSKEDLEIAAGMYVYHVKSNVTGKEKVGKFAVIK
jgi:hypothetical protein